MLKLVGSGMWCSRVIAGQTSPALRSRSCIRWNVEARQEYFLKTRQRYVNKQRGDTGCQSVLNIHSVPVHKSLKENWRCLKNVTLATMQEDKAVTERNLSARGRRSATRACLASCFTSLWAHSLGISSDLDWLLVVLSSPPPEEAAAPLYVGSWALREPTNHPIPQNPSDMSSWLP